MRSINKIEMIIKVENNMRSKDKQSRLERERERDGNGNCL